MPDFILFAGRLFFLLLLFFFFFFFFGHFSFSLPLSGSVVVERAPGMREVGGSIPGRVKQETLKFEALLSA